MIFIHSVIFIVGIFVIYKTSKFILKNQGNYKVSASKIALNFIHILLMIDNYNIHVSSEYKTAFTIFQKISEISNFWFSLECLIANKFSKKINFYHCQNVYQMIFLIFGILIVYLIEKKYQKGVERKFSKIILLLIFIFQPIIINQCLSNLTCTEIEGNYYYAKDPETNCYNTEYFLWIIFFLFTSFEFFCIFHSL